MKKMMIIAVLIGGMLMPAQIMAKNDKGNNKPKVEYNNKKKPQGKFEKKIDKRGVRSEFNNRNKYGKKKPNKPNVVVINKPAPPPPAPAKVVYKNDSFSAAASVLGIAALAAIIAN